MTTTSNIKTDFIFFISICLYLYFKDNNKIYSERGFYNTKTDISHFVKNAKLYLKERTVEGDSLYYDKNRGFASATKNITVIDTVQNFITKGNYAEIFELKDSLLIVDKAVGISIVDKDSTFIHGDTILITGQPKKRIIRTYHNVKIFKSDLQGKCDSIHTNQESGVSKMFRNPVIWSDKNQITGDKIFLKSNVISEELDSLIIRGNVFMSQKDSLIDGRFNQIKGEKLDGYFNDGSLDNVYIVKNSTLLYYMYSDDAEFIGMNKTLASSILIKFLNNENK